MNKFVQQRPYLVKYAARRRKLNATSTVIYLSKKEAVCGVTPFHRIPLYTLCQNIN